MILILTLFIAMVEMTVVVEMMVVETKRHAQQLIRLCLMGHGRSRHNLFLGRATFDNVPVTAWIVEQIA